MKNIINIFTFLLFCFVIQAYSFAYIPGNNDYLLLQKIEKKIDTMFPTKIDDMISLYRKLDSKIRYFDLQGNEQFVFLLEMIQKILRDKMFTQNQVCISSHVQKGDTVEVQYHVKNESGNILDKKTKSLVFNPIMPGLWKNLSYGVLGMKQGEKKVIQIPSYPVINNDNPKNLVIKKDYKSIAKKLKKNINIGDLLVLGSTKVEGVVIAKVIAIDGELITLDFSISGIQYPIYLTINIKRVNKFCTQDANM